MRIIYFNNCWFTNVGEAFIDLGGMALLKKIFPHAQIACISAMSDYYTSNVKISWQEKKHDIKNRILGRKPSAAISVTETSKMNKFLEADYVVLPGMVATLGFLEAKSRFMIDDMVSRGCKVIFLGMGGFDYEGEELQEFSRYLEKIKPEIVITRDNKVYENYKDVVNCVKGIDCAFWSKDVFDPRGFANSLYDVVAFNRSEEPKEFSSWENPVVRPWHMQFSYNKEKFKKNILISDTPCDYLTVYANANKVYTDLVHATIVSVMYGTPVKFSPVDKRKYALDALEDLKVDEKGFLSIAEASLEKQKEDVIKEIKRNLEC